MSGFNLPLASENGAAEARSKQMSSRLLNMKFMQRAGASSSPNVTKTQTRASEPQAKRRRFETVSSSIPSTPVPVASTPGTPFSAHSAVSSTNGDFSSSAAVSSNRTAWLAAAVGGETEWVLNVNVPAPQDNGTNGYEHREEEGSDSGTTDGAVPHSASSPRVSGRQTYGAFERKKKSATTNTSEANGQEQDDEELSSLSDASDSDAVPGTSPINPRSNSTQNRKRKHHSEDEADGRTSRKRRGGDDSNSTYSHSRNVNAEAKLHNHNKSGHAPKGPNAWKGSNNPLRDFVHGPSAVGGSSKSKGRTGGGRSDRDRKFFRKTM